MHEFPTPFCHLFQEEGQDYLYDVNTNALLAIEPPLAAVMPLVGATSLDNITAKLTREFSAPQIHQALEAVERGRGEGLFLANRPHPVPPAPCSRQDIDRNLQHLVLTVTERCNLRCRYCLHGAELGWVRGLGSRHMSPPTARKAIDYFLDRCDLDRKPMISFYGGEPLLELDLIAEAVAHIRGHARGKDALLAIDSNGVLLDEPATDLILRERIQLQVSLDGPADIHDRHRVNIKGGPTHAIIMDGLERFLRKDPSAAGRLVFVVTLAPPFDILAVARYFDDFPLLHSLGISGSPNLKVNFADLEGQPWPGLTNHYAQAAEQLETLRRAYLAAIAENRHTKIDPVSRALFEPDLVRFHKRSRKLLGTTASPGAPCALGRRKLHVDIDGGFQPCERTGSAFPLGLVQSGILPDRVAELEEGFWQGVAPHCANCWAVRLCGMCHGHLARSGVASLADLPESACRRERLRLEGTMRMMVQMLSMPPECRRFLETYTLE